MLIETHILQNFAPSNLNRDDTGSPKDCEFGGYRRARISSQCLKRAMREEFKDCRDRGLLPSSALAERTKRLVNEVMAPQLERSLGLQEEAARQLARAGLCTVGGFTERANESEADRRDNLTQYLFFVSPREIEELVTFCEANQDGLRKAFPDLYGDDGNKRIATAGAKRAAYQRLRSAVGGDALDGLQKRFDGGRAADLALFGRMLADLPAQNIDAASQVAHALSTHQVSVEFDYYTAVDDLKPDDTAGADMIGTVEFNSACFYRYANVDLGQLQTNLGDDADLARRTLEAFLRATVTAVPSGKQNSMAAHNPPSLIMTVTRHSGPWSLANAFVRPVRPGSGGLVESSIAALDDYWGRLDGLYGASASGVTDVCVATLDGDGLSALKSYQVSTLTDLVDQTVAAAFNAGGAGVSS